MSHSDSLMAGLRGAWKNYEQRKAGKWLMEQKRKKVLLVSCDTINSCNSSNLILTGSTNGLRRVLSGSSWTTAEIAAAALNSLRQGTSMT